MSHGLLLTDPLWLLVLFPAVVWTLWSLTTWRRGGRLQRSPESKGRARLGRGLRLTTFVLLALALAGLTAWRRQDRLTVIFAVDLSRSVGTAARQTVRDFLNQAARGLPKGDRAGVVVFGSEAMVEALPSEDWPDGTGGEILARPAREATNLEAAVRLSRSLFPPGDEARVVLLSDGMETVGSVEEELLRQPGDLDLVWVPLEVSDSPEVMVEKVAVPERVLEGQSHRVQAVLRASQATEATLRLYRGPVPVAASRVRLEPGRANVFAFDQVAAGGSGAVLYRATVEAAADGTLENNRAAALVEIEGAPSVLVVDEDAASMGAFLRVLEEAEMKVLSGVAQALPADLLGMAAYDSIILSDVAAARFSKIQLDTIKTYVEDFGGGLLMLGGPDSYGPGGYWRTPVEEVLPLNMEVKDRSYFPTLGLVLCLDKSGSMAGSAGAAKIEVAKAAAAEVTQLLTPSDRIGVVAFDSAAKWVVPMTHGAEQEVILSRLASLRAGGGTDAYPAMELAMEALDSTDVRVKHVILLTDGQLTQRDHEGLARQLRERGITISTVAVGTDADLYTLDRIAWAGDGRFYRAADIDLVPRIFLREAFKVARSWVVEETFSPVRNSSHPALVGLPPSLPVLGGYVAASEKAGAQHPLGTPRGDPLLSLWRVGLGKSVAFTSDAKARWAAPWMAWDGFPRFWQALVRWTLRRSPRHRLRLASQVQGGELRLTADVFDSAGGFINGAELEGRVVGPDGKSRSVLFRQSGPGRYEARVTAEEPGPYLAAVMGNGAGAPPGAATVSSVVPYSDEFRSLQRAPEALERLVAQGHARQVRDAAAGIFEHRGKSGEILWPLSPFLLAAAAVLLVAEVAARRLAVPKRLESWWAARRRRQEVEGLEDEPVRGRGFGSTLGSVEEVDPSPADALQPIATGPDSDSRSEEPQGARPSASQNGSSAYTQRLLDAKRRLRRRRR